MLASELHALRLSRWRVDGRAAHTGDELREFIDSCGMCLLYPERDLLFPTLIGAFAGTDQNLPAAKQAFADPRAAEMQALLQRLVRDKQAFRWPVPAHENELVIAAAVFPFFYALAADFEGGQQPAWASTERLSRLAQDAWKMVRHNDGPVAETDLRERLGGALTATSLQRALNGLWARLRIVPIGETEARDPIWESLARWSPAVMSAAQELPREAAVSALLFRYLEAVVATEQEQLETSFSFLISRSQLRDAINALLAARELTHVQIDRRRMLSVRQEAEPPLRQKLPRRERKP